MQGQTGRQSWEQFASNGAGTNDDPYVPIVSNASTGAQKKIISQCLDSVGDGSGTTNLIGNYATPTTFKIAPGAGEVFRIARLLGYVEDAGTFDTGAYGNGITLTNGIKLEYDYGATVVDLMGGNPVITNGEWSATCYDVTQQGFGIGNEFISIRWTFTKSGAYIRLDGDAGEELRMILEDDFSGLVKHRFLIQGYIE